VRHRNHRPTYSRSGLWVCSLIVGCIGLVLIVAGCSDNGLILDNNNSSEDNVSFFDLPYDTGALAKRSDIAVSESTFIQKRLKASEGGVIPLGPDETVEAFVVIQDSFEADTTFEITVTKILTTDGEMPIIFDFGPDGLQFSRPAVLRLNLFELFGKNTTSMELYWLDEETNEWEFMETLDADSQGFVYGTIPHFSTGAGQPGKGTTNPGTDDAD